MDEHNENVRVRDRRINWDQEETEEPVSGEQESEAKRMERKRAAEEYNKAASGANNAYPLMDFSTFVLSLSSSALTHLGEVPNPGSGEHQTNMALAKQTIDLMAILEKKTQGNLTPEEERLLKDSLFEVRMKYVQKAD